MKQQFLKGKTGTIKLSIYSANRPLVPDDSVLVTLYNPSGSVLQAQASASRDADTGEMSYSLTTVHTDAHDLNYKASWEYVSGGVTYYQDQLFDVVKSILAISVVDDDLYDELDSLEKVAKQDTSTATAGAAGTITDTIERKEDDNFWKGGYIEILHGTGAGQVRDITASVQSTGVLSVNPNFSTTPDTTSLYRVIKSFTDKIRQSFEKLETMFYNKGRRHSLILESTQIKIPLLYLTIHFIALDLRKELDDKWDLLARDYWTRFTESFNTMKLDYDTDESGNISGDEAQSSISELRISRA